MYLMTSPRATHAHGTEATADRGSAPAPIRAASSMIAMAMAFLSPAVFACVAPPLEPLTFNMKLGEAHSGKAEEDDDADLIARRFVLDLNSETPYSIHFVAQGFSRSTTYELRPVVATNTPRGFHLYGDPDHPHWRYSARSSGLRRHHDVSQNFLAPDDGQFGIELLIANEERDLGNGKFLLCVDKLTEAGNGKARSCHDKNGKLVLGTPEVAPQSDSDPCLYETTSGVGGSYTMDKRVPSEPSRFSAPRSALPGTPILIAWDAVDGASHYIVSTIGYFHMDTEICRTTQLSCSIPMPVNSDLGFTLEACNEYGCSSGHSRRIEDGPRRLSVNETSQDVLTATWVGLAGATHYVITKSNGKELCRTHRTTCDFPMVRYPTRASVRGCNESRCSEIVPSSSIIDPDSRILETLP